jgi:hypothetical protein
MASIIEKLQNGFIKMKNIAISTKARVDAILKKDASVSVETTQNQLITSSSQPRESTDNTLNSSAISSRDNYANASTFKEKASVVANKIGELPLNITNQALDSTNSVLTKGFKMIDIAGDIAVGLVDIADKTVIKSAGNISDAAEKGTKAFAYLTGASSALLGTVNGIVDRVNTEIEAANERRDELNKQKAEILKQQTEIAKLSNADNVATHTKINEQKNEVLTSKQNVKTEKVKTEEAIQIEEMKRRLVKETKEIEFRIRQEDAKSTKKLQQLDTQLNEEKRKQEELNDEFEIAQQIYKAKQDEEKKNVHIALSKNGYIDKKMKERGWTKNAFLPFFSNYGKFWKICQIKDINTEKMYDVDFELNTPDNEPKFSYYILVDDTKYYFSIQNLTGKEEQKNSVTSVTNYYIEINGTQIKNSNGDKINDNIFNAYSKKTWFKIPNRSGGRKTRRRNKRRGNNRIHKTNRRTRK